MPLHTGSITGQKEVDGTFVGGITKAARIAPVARWPERAQPRRATSAKRIDDRPELQLGFGQLCLGFRARDDPRAGVGGDGAPAICKA